MKTNKLTAEELTRKLLFYLLAAILGGCVPVMSLHPLYTEEDVIFEEKLLGTWVDDPNGPEAIWEFRRPEEAEKEYKLIVTDEEGKKGSFAVHLVKLTDRLFLDVYPDESPCADMEDPNKTEFAYNSFFLVPAHTFIKIDSIGPELKMQLTDDEEMETLLKEDPNAVKHEIVEGKPVLTASTKELQAFVLKYADDERLFSEEIVLSRKKPEEPADPNRIEQKAVEPNDVPKDK
jgi:hypothetical protein